MGPAFIAQRPPAEKRRDGVPSRHREAARESAALARRLSPTDERRARGFAGWSRCRYRQGAAWSVPLPLSSRRGGGAATFGSRAFCRSFDPAVTRM